MIIIRWVDVLIAFALGMLAGLFLAATAPLILDSIK